MFCRAEFADYHPRQAHCAIPLATWEQRCANIAQTIDVQPDFRSEVREGWSSYIESTYGTGQSVKGSSAVHNTETLVGSHDEEAPSAQQDFAKNFNHPNYIDYTIILIILIIPDCSADKHRQQNTTLSFHRLPGVC